MKTSYTSRGSTDTKTRSPSNPPPSVTNIQLKQVESCSCIQILLSRLKSTCEMKSVSTKVYTTRKERISAVLIQTHVIRELNEIPTGQRMFTPMIIIETNCMKMTFTDTAILPASTANSRNSRIFIDEPERPSPYDS